MAGQLRVLGETARLGKDVARNGARRTARTPITRAIESAEEQLLQLRGLQAGPTADVGHSAALIDNS
ncbi:hypothetical protein [Streptomyces phaeoluteigriseus]|uniref:hypothetical protein n=1 Tax=Streptomyces phaeoluteigriseus TaxID=114686 RepID=UPI00368D449A